MVKIKNYMTEDHEEIRMVKPFHNITTGVESVTNSYKSVRSFASPVTNAHSPFVNEGINGQLGLSESYLKASNVLTMPTSASNGWRIGSVGNSAYEIDQSLYSTKATSVGLASEDCAVWNGGSDYLGRIANKYDGFTTGVESVTNSYKSVRSFALPVTNAHSPFVNEGINGQLGLSESYLKAPNVLTMPTSASSGWRIGSVGNSVYEIDQSLYSTKATSVGLALEDCAVWNGESNYLGRTTNKYIHDVKSVQEWKVSLGNTTIDSKSIMKTFGNFEDKNIQFTKVDGMNVYQIIVCFEGDLHLHGGDAEIFMVANENNDLTINY